MVRAQSPLILRNASSFQLSYAAATIFASSPFALQGIPSSCARSEALSSRPFQTSTEFFSTSACLRERPQTSTTANPRTMRQKASSQKMVAVEGASAIPANGNCAGLSRPAEPSNVHCPQISPTGHLTFVFQSASVQDCVHFVRVRFVVHNASLHFDPGVRAEGHVLSADNQLCWNAVVSQ